MNLSGESWSVYVRGESVEAGEALEFMRRNRELLCRAYWKQLELNPMLRRYFWFGRGRHKVFPELENLKRAFEGLLRKTFAKKLPPPEAYGSLDAVEKPQVTEFYDPKRFPPRAWIGAFDLDLKHASVEPDEILPRFLLAVEALMDWGVEPEIRLSGGGLHLTFPFPQLQEPVTVNRELADWLGRRFKVPFDEKIYSRHRMFRLTFSWHKSGIFTLPLDPWELEEMRWEELRGLASSLSEVRERLKGYGSRWLPLGRVVEPEKLEKLLSLLKPVKLEPPIVVKKKRRVEQSSSGWTIRRYIPDLGPVEYVPELEEYGYIRVMVEKEVLLKDGKLNAAWLILAPAVARGIVTREEAENWFRKAAAAYNVDPEPYLKKLEVEVRRRDGKTIHFPEFALPLWRSLLEERRRDGEPLHDFYKAVRGPLLEALTEKGLLRKLG